MATASSGPDGAPRRADGETAGTVRLMKPAEVAARLNVSRRTVARLADSGRLPVVRTPGGHRRFSEAEVEAYARQ